MGLQLPVLAHLRGNMGLLGQPQAFPADVFGAPRRASKRVAGVFDVPAKRPSKHARDTVEPPMGAIETDTPRRREPEACGHATMRGRVGACDAPMDRDVVELFLAVPRMACRDVDVAKQRCRIPGCDGSCIGTRGTKTSHSRAVAEAEVEDLSSVVLVEDECQLRGPAVHVHVAKPIDRDLESPVARLALQGGRRPVG